MAGRASGEEVPWEIYAPNETRPRGSDRIGVSSWLALLALGLLLFLAGVVVGLGVSGTIASPLHHDLWAYPAPFALTVAGGALAMHAYERWYHHPDGPGGKQARRSALQKLPTFRVEPPPERRR